ncbi:hypothetical protein VIM7927_03809 [Vibrio mangrovi]|nr:hypothetical protein VIM7927_03809 [Vibrio mangrovi]
MFSVDDMLAGITRWLHSSAQTLSFDIDQHRCELCKISAGVRCAFDLESLGDGSLKPELLLNLTRAGLSHFTGVPAYNPETGYVLSQWIPLSEDAEHDSRKTLNVIESLSNQTAVWKELIAGQNGPRRTPAISMHTTHFPQSLSQQLRTF